MELTTERPSLADIFGRVWDSSGLTPALARHVLALGFADADVTRMRELAARNRAGALSAAEAAELDEFVRAGDLLAVMQSKARVKLGARGRAGRG